MPGPSKYARTNSRASQSLCTEPRSRTMRFLCCFGDGAVTRTSNGECLARGVFGNMDLNFLSGDWIASSSSGVSSPRCLSRICRACIARM